MMNFGIDQAFAAWSKPTFHLSNKTCLYNNGIIIIIKIIIKLEVIIYRFTLY